MDEPKKVLRVNEKYWNHWQKRHAIFNMKKGTMKLFPYLKALAKQLPKVIDHTDRKGKRMVNHFEQMYKVWMAGSTNMECNEGLKAYVAMVNQSVQTPAPVTVNDHPVPTDEHVKEQFPLNLGDKKMAEVEKLAQDEWEKSMLERARQKKTKARCDDDNSVLDETSTCLVCGRNYSKGWKKRGAAKDNS